MNNSIPQYMQCNSLAPVIKQKHKYLFDRLKLKSFTVDASKIVQLTKPKKPPLKKNPKIDLNSLVIKGRSSKKQLGETSKKTKQKFHSDYSSFTTFWKTVYSSRKSQIKEEDVSQLMTIRSLSVNVDMNQSIVVKEKRMKLVLKKQQV